jgi:Smr domain
VYKRVSAGVKIGSLQPELSLTLKGSYLAVMPFLDWLKRWRDKRSKVERGRVQDFFDEAEDEAEVDPFNPFPEPIRLEIRDVFDLHAIAPRDVKRVVEEYLKEAHGAGFRSVRIIHGKGKGVQREMVRTILARTTFVEDWTDAPPEAGSWGATIVRFSAEAK